LFFYRFNVKKHTKVLQARAKETLLSTIPDVKCKAHFREYNPLRILSREMAALHEPVDDGGCVGNFWRDPVRGL